MKYKAENHYFDNDFILIKFSSSPLTVRLSSLNSEEISQAITNFFTDLVGGSLDTVAKDFANETIGSISNFFQELTQDTPEPTLQDTITTQPIFQTGRYSNPI